MSEHSEIMKDLRMSRAAYLNAVRRTQSLEELRRKANKSARLKGKTWTQEQVDLIAVEGAAMLVKFAELSESA